MTEAAAANLDLGMRDTDEEGVLKKGTRYGGRLNIERDATHWRQYRDLKNSSTQLREQAHLLPRGIIKIFYSKFAILGGSFSPSVFTDQYQKQK